MAFDPFEARLQFLGLLRKLTASQQSIQTVVSYALKYGRKCGEDLWDCITEECGKGSLNTRINILYFLDTLCDPQSTSGLIPSASSSATTDFPYNALLNRDIEKLVGLVVPPSKEGILNLLSTKQIIESFRNKRTIPSEVCGHLLDRLEQRRVAPPPVDPTPEAVPTPTATPNPKKRPHPASLTNFSRNDTLRRMEEDRERHKRLREGMWVLPIPLSAPSGGTKDRPIARGVSKLRADAGFTSTNVSPTSPASPSDRRSLDNQQSQSSSDAVEAVDPVDVEFEQMWEATSDFDDDDREDLSTESMMLAKVREQRPNSPKKGDDSLMDIDVP